MADDTMTINEALAIMLIHEGSGKPWVIGPESSVIDEARKTVALFADQAMKRLVEKSAL